MSRNAEELADKIRAIAGPAPVSIGLILGSGLGHLAGAVEGVAIPYDELEGFPHAGVSGHNPNLVIGALEGVRVAVFGGRAHDDRHQCRRIHGAGHANGIDHVLVRSYQF